MELTYCNCDTPKNIGYTTSQEKWKLGDDMLYMNKVVWDDVDPQYFDVTFFKNGYQIRFMTWPESFEKVMTIFLDNFYTNKNYSMLEKA